VYVLDGVVEPSPTYWFAEVHPDGQRFRISGRQGRDRELEILSFANLGPSGFAPNRNRNKHRARRFELGVREEGYAAHDTVVTTVEGTQQVLSQSPVARLACLSLRL
jgi:hypothetical protein